MPLIEQQQKPARDSTGNCWVECKKYGKTDMDENFVLYRGTRHVNLGLCSDCSSRNKPQGKMKAYDYSPQTTPRHKRSVCRSKYLPKSRYRK